MAETLHIKHTTRYSYAAPVTLGSHRLMVRPRDSHDLRLIEATLALSPPGSVRWFHDVFGNSIAVVEFSGPATELVIESDLVIDRYTREAIEGDLDPAAAHYPFVYSADDRADLGRLLERHYPDPKGRVEAWARGFLTDGAADTLALLDAMNRTIKADFAYQARDIEGTQTPLETLDLGSGSCRDFALLMMEGLRCLGIATRFVSGYLYDPALDGAAADGTVGAGATHAWVDVYLPGAGWVEYDPTNGLIGSANLLRVAVARDPAQAVPIAGSFQGRPGDFLGMQVEVHVNRAQNAPGDAPSAAIEPTATATDQNSAATAPQTLIPVASTESAASLAKSPQAAA
ncbi:transglutaminase family protein [Segnochrobactrum spirostomi]|uniref:Transglutaminase family protein n=1 Tax=Segnochrobactrum spirostomi TaxID=2608987 RepID=A0A6A7Y566_9HYPH|nr:transglutaminase family protein [Segnochrobactrum spirostomi]MQT14333.1 transglutaminase family protein [Segnochrobactrum spirostomi]